MARPAGSKPGAGKRGRRPAAGDAGSGSVRRRPATLEAEALHRAAALCNAALAHVLDRTRSVPDTEAVVPLVDAAELCALTAAFVARDAHYVALLRDICSQQCSDAAQKSLRPGADPVLQACGRALLDAQAALDAAGPGNDPGA